MPSPLEGLSVFVAMPCLTDPTMLTTKSLLDTQEACHKHGVKVDFGFTTGSLVHHARDLLVKVFLDDKELNRLFWIDSDIKWRPVDFFKLLAGTLKHDIVCGVYPRRRDPPGFYIKIADEKREPDADGLVEILGTGMGFSCIRRNVIEHLSALAPKLKHAPGGEPFPAVFRQDDDGTSIRGEDFAFWADCREAGYKIYADATLIIGHVGTKVYQCQPSKSIP